MEPKKATTRGPSFSPNKDTAIAKAFMKTSEDPIIGTNRKKKLFYEAIAKIYNELFKPPNRALRPAKSIRNRVKLMSKKCSLFSACVARVQRLNPSGYNAQDLVSMETGLYNGIKMKSPTDDVGEPFKFAGAWEVLRKHPKFASESWSSQDISHTTSTESVTEDIDVTEGNERQTDVEKEQEVGKVVTAQRPQGRKASKVDFMKQKHYEEKIKVAREALQLQRKRADEIERQNDISLFTACGDSSPEAAEFFRISRKRVLEKLKEEESNAEGAGKRCRVSYQGDQSTDKAEKIVNVHNDSPTEVAHK